MIVYHLETLKALREENERLKSKLNDALSWIDGAKICVELWDQDTKGHEKWREGMMKKARELLK